MFLFLFKDNRKPTRLLRTVRRIGRSAGRHLTSNSSLPIRKNNVGKNVTCVVHGTELLQQLWCGWSYTEDVQYCLFAAEAVWCGRLTEDAELLLFLPVLRQLCGGGWSYTEGVQAWVFLLWNSSMPFISFSFHFRLNFQYLFTWAHNSRPPMPGCMKEREFFLSFEAMQTYRSSQQNSLKTYPHVLERWRPLSFQTS